MDAGFKVIVVILQLIQLRTLLSLDQHFNCTVGQFQQLQQ